MKEYIVKPGDNFYSLAQKRGGTWQDYVTANPGIDPYNLRIGQRIKLPDISPVNGYSPAAGKQKKGERCDDVFLEVEGVRIKVTRMGEPAVPHELHLIIPRTEVRKVQCPINGTLETTIMLSNVNIVNSPRL